MENNTTRNNRIIIASLVILAGVLLIAVLPGFVMKSMDAVLNGAFMKIEQTGNMALTAAPKVVKIFFPLWTGLSIAAGATLLILSVPIYRNERWGRPLALGMLAIPAITGAYILGPILFFAKNLVFVSILYMVVGLIPYFLVLLLEQSTLKTKINNLLVFTMLGVTIAYTFANGHTSLRMLWSKLIMNERALDHAFALGFIVVWIGVILALIGLPLLAGRKVSGWWMTSIGSLIMVVGTIQLTLGHTDVIEFYVGAAMSLATFILLITPKIGGTLIDGDITKGSFIPALEQKDQSI